MRIQRGESVLPLRVFNRKDEKSEISSRLALSMVRRKLPFEVRPPEYRIDGWANDEDPLEEGVYVIL